MPASRPSWRGQLRLSLVSIMVEIYPAQTSGRTSFRQIHAPSGKPINYQKVVAGLGPVDLDDIRKGYEYEKGEYVLLSDRDIDSVRLETKKTLDLVKFVPACEINPLYFDTAYFVAPADDLAEDAFRVIRDGLRETGRVGLGQMAMRGKEYLVALQPSGTGMMLNTMHYEDEVKRVDDFFSQIGDKAGDPDLVAMATQLIETKSAPFDAKAYHDNYEKALRELVAKKLKAMPKKSKPKPVEPEDEDQSKLNVVDLMASLKKSLEANQAKGNKPAARGLSAGRNGPAKPHAQAAEHKKAS